MHPMAWVWECTLQMALAVREWCLGWCIHMLSAVVCPLHTCISAAYFWARDWNVVWCSLVGICCHRHWYKFFTAQQHLLSMASKSQTSSKKTELGSRWCICYFVRHAIGSLGSGLLFNQVHGYQIACSATANKLCSTTVYELRSVVMYHAFQYHHCHND